MPDIAAPNGAVATPDAPAASASTPPAEVLAFPQTKVGELMRRLVDSVETDPKPPEEPEKPKEPVTPDPKAKDPKAAPEKPKEPETPIAPAISLRKPKVKRPELPVSAPVAPVEAKPIVAKPDPKWEEELEPNEKEMLADAREMAQTMPERYKGFDARTEKFLKEHRARTAAEDFDPQSPEYKAWVAANQPSLTRKELREFEEVRVANRVKAKTDEQLTDLKYKLFVREHEPKIEEAGRRVFSELANMALPDEVAEAVKKDGYQKAVESYKLELETAQQVLGAATEDIKELNRLTTNDPETKRPMVTEAFDPSDPKFAQHDRLRKIMDEVCDGFKANAPQAQQFVNGKWFVTREEWARIRPEARHQFWTLSNAQIIDQMKGSLKGIIANTISQKRAQLEGYGFTRAARVAVAAAPKPEATPSPAPRGSPIPGGQETPPSPETDARAARVHAAMKKEYQTVAS